MKFKKKGTYSDAKRSVRPRKSTPRDDHIIRTTAVRALISSAGKIRSVLFEKGANINGQTVCRRLVIVFVLKAHKPAKKPRLTLAMKAKRLGFAKEHAKWTIQQWQQVFFFDECTVQQLATCKRHVCRSTGKQFDKRYTTQTTKHPASVMIWGGMSVNGTAGLFFLPPGTTMNDQKYVDLLKDKLKLYMAIHKCKIFMQDGAPCHRCKIVTQFLKSKKI